MNRIITFEIRYKPKKKKKFKKPKKVKFKKKTIKDYQLLAKGLTYDKFLQTKYWQLVRKKVFRRDSYKCIICGSSNNLRCHHNTYKHHFAEHKHLYIMDTLCENCHKIYHEEINDKVK